MVCSGKLVNYLYLYTGTSIILKYMHNTNNNTVYEDITLWSTERSCGVQARGVTTPKSTHQYPCIRRLKRACGPPPSIHASAGAEPTCYLFTRVCCEKKIPWKHTNSWICVISRNFVFQFNEFFFWNFLQLVHDHRSVVCPHCGKLKRNEAVLKSHVKSVHEKRPCLICGQMVIFICIVRSEKSHYTNSH